MYLTDTHRLAPLNFAREHLDFDWSNTIFCDEKTSAQENLYLAQFDVCTAFLNGKLKEEISAQKPDGFSDGTSNVWKLPHSLYGLKQAPRCWNSCFEGVLLDMGFKQCDANCCLYIKVIDNKKLLTTLYVDDGLVAASDEELADIFLKDLGNRLRIITKPASYYLGLNILKKKIYSH